MRTGIMMGLLLAGVVTTSPAGAQQFEPMNTAGLRWFKGNTHTHTTESDGDSPPAVVAKWYKDHGYRFLVLSDHNVFTDPKTLAQLVDSTFLLIPGEELTTAFGKKPIHVNGLNIPHVLAPQKDSTSVLGTIQKNVDEVRSVQGVPHINHPNFGWAITDSVLLQVQRDKLVEIFNGHPTVHNLGGDDSPGMEQVWDFLLTNGKRIYGIAVDDAHHFQGEFGPTMANPGRGWVSVLAASLDAGAIMESLEAGRFYASTGVELDAVAVEPRTLKLTVHQRGNFKYTTEFVGEGGRVLATVGGVTPSYTLRGGETYVRARVRDSGGSMAWTQPVFVQKK